jgi:hypothetical protein
MLLLSSFYTYAQIVDIPDANFKDALLNSTADFDGDGIIDGSTDTNNDGEIQVVEAEAVLGLQFYPFYELSSLVGIESFVNLTWLELFLHEIEVLDLSQNNNLEKLICFSNNLSELILPQNSSLIELDCSSNHLIDLDVSQSSNLEILRCYNNEIATIDLTNNNQLEWLIIYMNQLQSLDITNNVSLEILNCGINFIEDLDFTQNPNLIQITVYDNLLTNIDVSQNSNLQYLQFGSNQISSIDITQNTELILLEGVYNSISDIDLSQNSYLEYLKLPYNQLATLDVSLNNNLISFNCKGNLLTSLNIQNGNNVNMTQMWAYENSELTCIQVDEESINDLPLCDNQFENGWCIDSWTIYSEDCENLGVLDNLKSSFVLYPNPTQNTLFIDTQLAIETVTIYNLQGQLFKGGTSSRIDVSQLTKGLYFVQVIIDGKIETKKFLKE